MKRTEIELNRYLLYVFYENKIIAGGDDHNLILLTLDNTSVINENVSSRIIA